MLVGKTVMLVAIGVLTLVVVVALMRYEFTIDRVAKPPLKNAKRWHVLSPNATVCKNTIQGQTYITDERGMLIFHLFVNLFLNLPFPMLPITIFLPLIL